LTKRAKGQAHADAEDHGWFSQPRTVALALILATLIALYLCYRLMQPFLPALAWALALAVIAHPLHRRIRERWPYPNVAAGVSVIIVVLLIVAPAAFVTTSIVQEAGKLAANVQQQFWSGEWRKQLENTAALRSILNWIDTQVGRPEDILEPSADGRPQPADDAQSQEQPAQQPASSGQRADTGAPLAQAAGVITSSVRSFVTGTIWFGMQMFITTMALFFFLRDRQRGLDALRSLLPLSRSEADEVFTRVDDTIHATIFGSVVVAMVQGFMGGLMFWILGLPTPLVWGAIMGLLAIVPVLGTFVIWMPTAVFLALQGEWGKAAILVAWGALAIGLIDNLLYPMLVGQRLRFHTMVVFIAIVGGLALFGASGVILGPLVVATTDALMDIWRRRTAHGGTLEEKVAV
jgi:predicted PurR-regulated permease PerM